MNERVTMCDSCPFGNEKKQAAMRKVLRPGRFNSICQDVFAGAFFACHKTTSHDDEGDELWTGKELECFGAIEFRRQAIEGRNRSERRASRLSDDRNLHL